jgi:hypothetical protein
VPKALFVRLGTRLSKADLIGDLEAVVRVQALMAFGDVDIVGAPGG